MRLVLLALALCSCASSKLAVHDAAAVARSAARPRTLLVAGAIAGSIALDHATSDLARRGNLDAFAERVEPLGGRYSDRVLAGFLLAGVARDDANMRAVAFDGIVSSLIASKVITPALKQIVGRERPNGGGESFPSNHATQAFVVASVVADHYYDRPWIDAAAYTLASAVGWARVRHDAHHFSDVVAGAAIGTAVGKIVVRTNQKERARWSVIPTAGGVIVRVRF